MFGVGAFTVSYHDHDVRFRGENGRFRLTLMRSGTYCIKFFCVCTLFFYDFPRSFKKFTNARCLCNNRHRRFPGFWVLFQPFFHRFRTAEYQRMPAPAGDPGHLRVGRVANNDGSPALLLRLGRQDLNAADIGTGGVHTADATGFQTVQNLLGLPVGTDNHRVVRL